MSRSNTRRKPGRRGRETRVRLIEATAALLSQRPFRDLHVIDIARDVGVSPATFYQYFADVETVVTLLMRQVIDASGNLVRQVRDTDWNSASSANSARELVDIFLDFWHEHAPVLRVIELAIVGGDRHFRQLRNDFLEPITRALAVEIADQRGPDAHAETEAAVLSAMLTQVAAHESGLYAWGIGIEEMRDALAAHLLWGVTRQNAEVAPT